VLPLRRDRPALRRDDMFLAKGVGALGAVENPTAVDPGPEIGRDRNVVRWSRCNDMLGECCITRRDVTQYPWSAPIPVASASVGTCSNYRKRWRENLNLTR
jgi:hypothetical protein